MLFLLHILVMATATLGIIAGVGTAMFFRRNRNWLKIHRSVNSLSLGGMTAGVIMAYFYVADSGGRHIGGLHQSAGLAAFILALMTLSMGYYHTQARNKPALRTAHRWLGRLSLLIILTAAVLGLRLINLF